MDIQLNFVNRSNDKRNSSFVIFQKNTANDFDELAVAWMVISHCAPGDHYSFAYPLQMMVSASDSYGNFTPQLAAQNGQLFQMSLDASGDRLAYAGPATSSQEIDVLNALPVGAIDANIYRGGHLLATKASIAPQQKAVFSFKPTLWIGAASQVEQGQVMNSAVLSSINTELSLIGIASADIVMTGGGPGPNATPLRFGLENVVYT